MSHLSEFNTIVNFVLARPYINFALPQTSDNSRHISKRRIRVDNGTRYGQGETLAVIDLHDKDGTHRIRALTQRVATMGDYFSVLAQRDMVSGEFTVTNSTRDTDGLKWDQASVESRLVFFARQITLIKEPA